MKLLANRRFASAAWAAVLCVAVAGLTESSSGRMFYRQIEPAEDAINRARGEAALAEAREHMDAHRWQRAIDAYQAALSYLPGDPEALEGLRQAQAALDQAPIIEGVAEDLRVQLGRAREEFGAARRRATELLDQKDFSGAERVMLTGQIRLRQSRNLFSQREFDDLNTQAEELLDRIDRERESARLVQDEITRREAERAQERARTHELQQRRRLIGENLLRVRQLQRELKYDEALQVIDEILFIDEHNSAALVLHDAIETTMLYREFAEVQRWRESGYPWLSLEAQRSLIPLQPNVSGPGDRSTSGIMGYPEDWAQLSLRRTHEAGFRESAANRRVARVLSETRIPIDFTGNTFDQVVAFLGQVTGLNFYVDWKALDFMGVDRQEQISLHLADVSVASALDRVLEQVGNGLDRPQWAIQDGIVSIASEEALRQHTVTIVYDIRDLLFEVPFFGNAPQLDLSSALNQGGGGFGGSGGGGFGGGGLGGGGGGGGFGGGGSGGGGSGSIFSDPSEEPPRLSRDELVQEIVSIVQENVDPDGWRDLGGDTGTLQELNGNLIITNTLGNHRAIEGLLSQLREIRALQINVEARFLAVSSDWFEQIGVDLDLYFNTNTDVRQQQLAIDPLGHLSDFFGPDGRLLDPLIYGSINTGDAFGISNAPAYGSAFGVPVDSNGNGIPDSVEFATGPTGSPIRTTQGFSPIPFVQDSLGLVETVADLSGFGETVLLANPAVAIGVQFLDDIQVDLLIEATQADRRSVVVTAPRLTFFNGQRAWVAVADQVSFISALIPITGDAAGAFQPIPGVVNEGVVLDVEGVISADRRYVTMTVIVSLSELVNIREIEVTGAVGGTGQIGGGGQFAATQELPEVEVSLVQTTVSVPDKGTVLLGGTRRVDEIEVESGVPVLSKIPFVNRFFTNRLTSKSEKTLLILIRPEIIIQQENEDLLFPGLSDSLGGAASYLQ
ncbi:MAG: type II secretion system protein GspD [Planctomycetota bacterium]|jgi:general secretion pathway protein D